MIGGPPGLLPSDIIDQILAHKGDERTFEYGQVEEQTACTVYNTLQNIEEGRGHRSVF
jgi:hypothetical protein